MTKKETSAIALFGDKAGAVPAHLQTEAPAGNENVKSGDLSTPQLNLLQQLSPQCTTVDGAKPGMFINSITNELFESVNVVNLFFRKQFALFKDRKKGQGFAGNFSTEADALTERATLENPNDWNIVETDQHYCLLLDEDGEASTPAVFYMSASKMKVSKEWNTQIQVKGPNADRFAGVWNLSSQTATNGAGQAYSVPIVEFMGWAPELLHSEGRKAYEGFMKPAPLEVDKAA